MVLTQKELHDALSGRHGAAVQAQLDRAAVGIAGLGGLGSHIAARAIRRYGSRVRPAPRSASRGWADSAPISPYRSRGSGSAG